MEYRFFRHNAAGIVDTAESVRLDDDDAALAYGMALRHAALVEVWAGSRRVGLVPPSPANDGPAASARRRRLP